MYSYIWRALRLAFRDACGRATAGYGKGERALSFVPGTGSDGQIRAGDGAMIKLEDLKKGLHATGLVPGRVVTVVSADFVGTDALVTSWSDTAEKFADLRQAGPETVRGELF